MHCNFVTPPDIIESVLIIDATQQQIEQCAEVCKSVDRPYDVYFYHADMDNTDWLAQIIERADTILQAEDSTVPILQSIRFGQTCRLLSPADFFNK